MHVVKDPAQIRYGPFDFYFFIFFFFFWGGAGLYWMRPSSFLLSEYQAIFSAG